MSKNHSTISRAYSNILMGTQTNQNQILRPIHVTVCFEHTEATF